jgi:hypothetical protein
MSEKALVYIVTIKEIENIPKKDLIGLISTEETSFKTIGRKADYKIGDKAIYFETGGVLPLEPEYQFLEKSSYSKKYNGYRIKTIKMGEAYSEGLLFPFETLKHKIPSNTSYDPTDLTEIFSVRRLEDEVPDEKILQKKKPWLRRKIEKWLYKYFKIKFQRKGFGIYDFPSDLIPKTDETQVQSLKYVFQELQGMPIYASIKIDGQSATYALYNGIFSISSRNRTVYRASIKKAIKEINEDKAKKYLSISNHAYCAAKYNMPQVLQIISRELPCKNIAIQGEVAGPGIQKNRLGLSDFELFIFSVYDIDQKKFFTLNTLMFVIQNSNLKIVPIISEKTIFDWKDIDELLNWSVKFSYDNGHPAEGVVIRANPYDEIYMPKPMHKMSNMLSLKVINPLFKIKTQDSEENA